MSDEELRARMAAATAECNLIVRELDIARREKSYEHWTALFDRLTILRADVLDMRNTLMRRHERERVSSN